jgi:hypothetical protein
VIRYSKYSAIYRIRSIENSFLEMLGIYIIPAINIKLIYIVREGKSIGGLEVR